MYLRVLNFNFYIEKVALEYECIEMEQTDWG